MKKCITIPTPQEKERIVHLLAEHQIPYRIKAQNLSVRNPLDFAQVGTMGSNQIQLSYILYVPKEHLVFVLFLIRSK